MPRWELQGCRTLIHQRLFLLHFPTTEKNDAFVRTRAANSWVQLGIKVPRTFSLDLDAHDSFHSLKTMVMVIGIPCASIASRHQPLRIAWIALKLAFSGISFIRFRALIITL